MGIVGCPDGEVEQGTIGNTTWKGADRGGKSDRLFDGLERSHCGARVSSIKLSTFTPSTGVCRTLAVPFRYLALKHLHSFYNGTFKKKKKKKTEFPKMILWPFHFDLFRFLEV